MGYPYISDGQEPMVTLLLLKNCLNCKPLGWPSAVLRNKPKQVYLGLPKEPIANNYKSRKKKSKQEKPNKQTK